MPAVGDTNYKKMRPGPVGVQLWNRGTGLGVRVVVVVMAMMVMRGGESRCGKHHQKQGGGKDLFHAANVALLHACWKCNPGHASREERGKTAVAELFHSGTGRKSARRGEASQSGVD